MVEYPYPADWNKRWAQCRFTLEGGYVANIGSNDLVTVQVIVREGVWHKERFPVKMRFGDFQRMVKELSSLRRVA